MEYPGVGRVINLRYCDACGLATSYPATAMVAFCRTCAKENQIPEDSRQNYPDE